MSKKVNINYNDTFGTTHSRDYYRGASFHFSGKWMPGVHYLSDDYNIDFVVHGQCLLACAKSHLSSVENEPTEYIRDASGSITGVISKYWDFVLTGIAGKAPGIKIIDNYWYTCEDIGANEPIWVNTGIKAKFEFSDLTEDDINQLAQPALDVIDNMIVQEAGQNTDKIMSQKTVTDLLNALDVKITSKVLVNTTEYWNQHGNMIPEKGQVIVYSDYTSYVDSHGDTIYSPGIKIGSGNGYLADLGFIGEVEKQLMLQHITNTNIHITSQERLLWNSKLNVDDNQEVVNEILILNRN